MTEKHPGLVAKDNSVNLLVHPAFSTAAPILNTAWIMYGVTCVVTSGKDGKHSKNSAHYVGKAIDLRINNLPFSGGDKKLAAINLGYFGLRLATALVTVLGPYWFLVLEKDHFHLEYAEPGDAPNIKNYKAGVHFYQQSSNPPIA